MHVLIQKTETQLKIADLQIHLWLWVEERKDIADEKRLVEEKQIKDDIDPVMRDVNPRFLSTK